MNTTSNPQQRPTRGNFYQIRIGQHLDPECSDWLGGMAITNLEGGEAILFGLLIDQAALHGILQHLRDLNVTLIACNRMNPGIAKPGVNKAPKV